MINHMVKTLYRYKFLLIILLHLFIASASYFLAFMIRFDFTLGTGENLRNFMWTLPFNVAIFFFSSVKFNLFHGIWRYVNFDDLKDIVKTSALSTLVFMFIIVLSGKFPGYPRSIYILNFIFFVILNGGTRFTIRVFRESLAPMSENDRNILIIGAGAAGREIVKTINSAKRKKYIPVGFIDKDTFVHGKRIEGIKVLGDITTIQKNIRTHRIHEVLIAIPEANEKTVKEIVNAARIPGWEMKFKITPSVLDIMSGKYRMNQIRDVSIHDLVSRTDITLDERNVRKHIAGKTVLVTGAGGSVGSEISFQVAAYQPSRIFLLDENEKNAYMIDQNLKRRYASIAIHTVVGSILDKAVLDLIMREYPVDIILHAASYKHTYLMEWNPIACLKNNVVGTAAIVSAAERNGVKQFILISTDKAVNPRNMMGISKRLSERVVLERHASATKCIVVRFGNVLGSSGSVIPLFQRQIREGGPVTVTSPEASRSFMSIQEAVQLFLRASSLDESNAVFMFETGEQVSIVDLAKNLIELSGLKPGEDIEIKFTGLRNGEMIREDILSDNDFRKTSFDKIRIQKNNIFEPERIDQFIHDLKSNIELGNIKTIYKDIIELIPEMNGPTFEEVRKNMFG